MEQRSRIYTDGIGRFLDDKYRLIHHILFWIFIYLDEILSLVGLTDEMEFERVFFLITAVDIFVVYLVIWYLVPKFLYNNHIWMFLILSSLFIFTDSMISYYLSVDFWFEEGDTEVSSYITSTFIYTANMVVFAIGLKLFKHYLRTKEHISSLETSNLKTELAFLKTQINPHFLFNSLNNVYVQSKVRPEDASESILLLSELLRYQLYDCAKDKVSLEQEVEHIKNHLRLDRLRKSDSKILFEEKGPFDGIMIPPFLFMPLVENAIKYSMSKDGSSEIDIALEASNKRVVFSIQNSVSYETTEKDQGGIGLTNLKRRLELLFPGKYELKTNLQKNNFYKVDLKIELT